jgi:hypothetical protein
VQQQATQLQETLGADHCVAAACHEHVYGSCQHRSSSSCGVAQLLLCQLLQHLEQLKPLSLACDPKPYCAAAAAAASMLMLSSSSSSNFQIEP